MMISFGIWMISELFEAIAEENCRGGFGIFLIIRFFWIRNTTDIESKNIE